MIDSVDLTRINEEYTLEFKTGEEVLHEIVIPVDLARQLRSGLEACVSGRRQKFTATIKKSGFRLPPRENDVLNKYLP